MTAYFSATTRKDNEHLGHNGTSNKPPDPTHIDTSEIAKLTDDEKQQISKILDQQNPDALAAQVAKIFRQKFQKDLAEKPTNNGKPIH